MFKQYIFIVAIFFVTLIHQSRAAAKSTNILCTPNGCPQESTPGVDNGRSLGNKVGSGFDGHLDVWANDGATFFTTDIQVKSGQAWPRISEGVTTNQKTSGYPISVGEYVNLENGRYLTYFGEWIKRTNGENPGGEVSGNLQNGAYIWLNDPKNIMNNDRKQPKWEWTIEINVWNRYAGSGVPPGRTQFDEDYFEGGNRRYAVWGGVHEEGFYAMYYLLQDPHRGTPNMELNLQELLKHAMRVTGDRIPANYDLIEVAIAAEGHPVADGKFRANIITMGRP